MSTLSTPPTTRQASAELARALAAAQSNIKAIPHDARNEYHHYAYTSSESILAECKAVLSANGLSLLPAGQVLQVNEDGLFRVLGVCPTCHCAEEF